MSAMANLTGIAASIGIGINTVFWASYVLIVAAIRWLLKPLPASQKPLLKAMDLTIDGWVSGNRVMFRALGIGQVELDWVGAQPSRDRWYLIVSNHQCWGDILVLQNTLRHRLPPLRFFTKAQLIYLPFLGFAMYLLGFPYVKRVSAEAIAQNPALKTADRDNTMKACERFQALPTGVLNFLEGTRFTEAKHASQEARFENLLNPKIGGLSFVLSGMPEHVHEMIDVTITYPGPAPSFWEFLCGTPARVRMRVDVVDIPGELRVPDYGPQEKARLADWIEQRWQAKDRRLRGIAPADV